ncbi:hypothetical protein C4R89_14090 [Clostridioides difficile]|nr:hypothetical protein [Clostridioides difficile]
MIVKSIGLDCIILDVCKINKKHIQRIKKTDSKLLKFIIMLRNTIIRYTKCICLILYRKIMIFRRDCNAN